MPKKPHVLKNFRPHEERHVCHLWNVRVHTLLPHKYRVPPRAVPPPCSEVPEFCKNWIQLPLRPKLLEKIIWVAPDVGLAPSGAAWAAPLPQHWKKSQGGGEGMREGEGGEGRGGAWGKGPPIANRDLDNPMIVEQPLTRLVWLSNDLIQSIAAGSPRALVGTSVRWWLLSDHSVSGTTSWFGAWEGCC